jgi:hypothetical protein
MERIREFLILKAEAGFVLYAPSQFPRGTPIGPDARRLTVVGPSSVHPPKSYLTGDELDQWRADLEDAGYSATIGPFWRNPPKPEEVEEEIRRGELIPLKDAFDELLRRAAAEGR